jgi:hypothetical protein
LASKNTMSTNTNARSIKYLSQKERTHKYNNNALTKNGMETTMQADLQEQLLSCNIKFNFYQSEFIMD